jgi:hypothetical protein
MTNDKNYLNVCCSRHAIIYLVIQQLLLHAQNALNYPPVAVKAKLIGCSYEFGRNLIQSYTIGNLNFT